jgi:hypothetical protein
MQVFLQAFKKDKTCKQIYVNIKAKNHIRQPPIPVQDAETITFLLLFHNTLPAIPYSSKTVADPHMEA